MLVFLVLNIPVFSGFVGAAYFDCSLNTLTMVERLICSDQQLSQLDDHVVAASYARMIDADNTTMLRKRQRGWRRQRDQCKNVLCLRDIYIRRLEELSEEFVILDGIVSVTANINMDSYLVHLSVKGRKHQYNFDTSMETYLATEREQGWNTGWKGPYLFVRQSSGIRSCWRCTVEIVFRIKDGHLIYIGNVYVRHDEPFGSSYSNGKFLDIYNKFEINSLTSHAAAPSPWLVLYESKGKLEVDINRTWEKNQPRFKKNQALIQSSLTETKQLVKKVNWTHSETENGLIFNAVLSTYCNKTKFTDELLRSAEILMDKDREKIFREIILQVIPGEHPGTYHANSNNMQQFIMK
ncbi:hypothetical protein QUF90_19405 [Desulfococcaceae bacterium HSG9]|nr:hypothetical protein [Desulfococcaceae bacterium HSG9]